MFQLFVTDVEFILIKVNHFYLLVKKVGLRQIAYSQPLFQSSDKPYQSNRQHAEKYRPRPKVKPTPSTDKKERTSHQKWYKEQQVYKKQQEQKEKKSKDKRHR